MIYITESLLFYRKLISFAQITNEQKSQHRCHKRWTLAKRDWKKQKNSLLTLASKTYPNLQSLFYLQNCEKQNNQQQKKNKINKQNKQRTKSKRNKSKNKTNKQKRQISQVQRCHKIYLSNRTAEKL